mmetsp:Transcript_28122/g.41088  ORF Transcript_28122/g.41088 Transcript_28122/m.41088 type:complete len:427 (+) Transcript_28122:218-1498(+)
MVDIVVSQPVSILTAPTPGGSSIEAPTSSSSSSLTTAASSVSGGIATVGEHDAKTTVTFDSSADNNTTAASSAAFDSYSDGVIVMSSHEHSSLLPSVTDDIDHRDRGLSFEFFSFGLNEDEPLPPTTFSSHDAIGVKDEDISSLHPLLPPLMPQQTVLHNKRPRGDSIIFDPVSFSDGGIHEENALLKTRGVTATLMSLDEHEELAIMNCPGFVEATPADGTAISSVRPDVCTSFRSDDQIPPITSSSTTTSSSVHAPLTTRSHTQSSLPDTTVSQQTVQHNSVPSPIDCASSTVVATGVTPATDHGGAALASAQQQPWMNNSTTSTSTSSIPTTSTTDPNTASASSATVDHSVTTCPLDLVNKDGRIGIYRPEARKARIAKFHSKRKMRIWRKRIKYDCRKKLADSRPRIKGRFVKRSDEDDEGS